MRRFLPFLAGFVVALVASAVSAGPPPEVRLAVIPQTGRLGPTPTLVAQLEVALSNEAGIGLVERQFIDQIWREQTLSFMGLSTGAGAIQAGKLLNADMLLLLERLEESLAKKQGKDKPPALLRCRVVEVRTGIVLGSLIWEAAGLEKDPAPVLATVRRAAAKSRLAPEKRRYVALLDFRSEEAGRGLHPVRDALAVLFVNDLAASPAIVMLERGQLRRLREEESLTGFELELQGSALLLTGGVRRAQEEGQLRLTVLIEKQGKKAGPTANVTGARADLAKLSRELVRELLKSLQAQPLDTPALSPQQAAELFFRQADRDLKAGKLSTVAGALEASLALDPNPKLVNRVIDAYKWLRYAFLSRAKRAAGVKAPEMPALGMAAAVRQTELTCDRWRRQARPDKPMKRSPVLGLHYYLTMSARLAKSDPEARSLWLELGRLHQEQYFEALALAQRHWTLTGNREPWTGAVQSGIFFARYYTEDPAEWRQILFRIIKVIENPPVKAEPKAGETTVLDEVARAFLRFTRGGGSGLLGQLCQLRHTWRRGCRGRGRGLAWSAR